jgi:hypothetical protein
MEMWAPTEGKGEGRGRVKVVLVLGRQKRRLGGKIGRLGQEKVIKVVRVKGWLDEKACKMLWKSWLGWLNSQTRW